MPCHDFPAGSLTAHPGTAFSAATVPLQANHGASRAMIRALRHLLISTQQPPFPLLGFQDESEFGETQRLGRFQSRVPQSIASNTGQNTNANPQPAAQPQDQAALPELSTIRVCCLFNKNHHQYQKQQQQKTFLSSAAGRYFIAKKISNLGATVSLQRARKYLIVTPYQSPLVPLIRRQHKKASNRSRRGRTRSRKNSLWNQLYPNETPNEQQGQEGHENEMSRPKHHEVHTAYPYTVFDQIMIEQDQNQQGKCGLFEMKPVENPETLNLNAIRNSDSMFLLCLPSDDDSASKNKTNDHESQQRKAADGDVPPESDTILEALNGGPSVEKKKEMKQPPICRCEIVRFKALLHRELLAKLLNRNLSSLRKHIVNASGSNVEAKGKQKMTGNATFYDTEGFDFLKIIRDLHEKEKQLQTAPTPTKSSWSKDIWDPATIEHTPPASAIRTEPVFDYSWIEEQLYQFLEIRKNLLAQLRLVCPNEHVRSGFSGHRLYMPQEATLDPVQQLLGAQIPGAGPVGEVPPQPRSPSRSPERGAGLSQWMIPKPTLAELLNGVMFGPTELSADGGKKCVEDVNKVVDGLLLDSVIMSKIEKEMERRLSTVQDDMIRGRARIRLLKAVLDMISVMQATQAQLKKQRESRSQSQDAGSSSMLGENEDANLEDEKEDDEEEDNDMDARDTAASPRISAASNSSPLNSIRSSLPNINNELSAEEDHIKQVESFFKCQKYCNQALMDASQLINNARPDLSSDLQLHDFDYFDETNDDWYGQSFFHERHWHQLSKWLWMLLVEGHVRKSASSRAPELPT